MNIDDTVMEWPGQTDGQVANAIFGTYGFTPADANTDDDSPAHDPDGHTSVPARDRPAVPARASPGARARSAGSPAPIPPGQRTGYFIRPSVDAPAGGHDLAGRPERLDGRHAGLRLGRDAAHRVDASQVDLTQAPTTARTTDTDSSGLTTLADRDLPTYSGRSSTLLLTTPADVAELPQRTAAVLTESGLFARCTGEADADRLGAVLRAGDVVAIAGAGAIHSGNWLVWTVRHRFTLDCFKMQFTLVRNARRFGTRRGRRAGLGGGLAALGGAL